MPKTKTKTKVKKSTSDSQIEILRTIAATLVKLDNRVSALETKPQTAETRTVKRVSEDGSFRKEVTADIVPQVQNVPPRGRYELWAYDEYSQGTIVSSATDVAKVLKAARDFVTEQNVENALAAGEKDKAWEAYFPVIFEQGTPSQRLLYGGNKRDGKHYIYVLNNGKWDQRVAPGGIEYRFYLGENNERGAKTDWYLTDHKKKPITSLSDILLDRKTVLFVKIA